MLLAHVCHLHITTSFYVLDGNEFPWNIQQVMSVFARGSIYSQSLLQWIVPGQTTQVFSSDSASPNSFIFRACLKDLEKSSSWIWDLKFLKNQHDLQKSQMLLSRKHHETGRLVGFTTISDMPCTLFKYIMSPLVSFIEGGIRPW